jgi:quinoprotein glucose dehydrogenase
MFGPQGLPIVKPPYGRITAIDLNSGDHLWMVPNADTPDWIKNHPALKGMHIPPTGRYEHVGLLVTKTLDKKSGATIFEFKLPANQSSIPMTYSARGKQYIVVGAGAVGVPGEFVALTLDN